MRALQPKIRTDFQNGTNGTERVMCLNDGVTVFRRTFDIPSVLEQIDNRTESWRSISTPSTAHSFVVHPRQTSYESKTLRVGRKVAEILQLLKRPRREDWIWKNSLPPRRARQARRLTIYSDVEFCASARRQIRFDGMTCYLIATGFVDSTTSWSNRGSPRNGSQ